MSDFDLSQYSPYSPQFTKLTLPNAGQRVAEGPTTPAKASAPLPLAFKNATMPPAEPTPAPQSPAVAIAKLDKATEGNTTDFSHDAFEDADLLSFTSTGKAAKAETPDTKTADKPSKIQTYNQTGIIGIIGGLFGGGDKKADATTENEPPTKSHAPTSEELELPTAPKKATPQEAPQEDPTSTPGTSTSGTGASSFGIQPKQTPQNARGEVSMNTVDGSPDPDFDKKLAAAEAQKKATQNGQETTDETYEDALAEMNGALQGTPEQQKAYLEAHPNGPHAQNPADKATASGQKPKVEGFAGTVKPGEKPVVQGFAGTVKPGEKPKVEGFAGNVTPGEKPAVDGLAGPVIPGQKPKVEGFAGTVTPGQNAGGKSTAPLSAYDLAADPTTGIINNNDPRVIAENQRREAENAKRFEEQYGPGRNPNDPPKNEGGFFSKIFG